MFRKYSKFLQGTRSYCYSCYQSKPRHLICFKQWSAKMVKDVIASAMNLKSCCRDTHGKRLNILQDIKVTILQEVNEPILNLAVSKAATLLGAYDVTVVDTVMWENDYVGRVFSLMSDVIFTSTLTHLCVQRFADQSMVPVMCMRSRTHASIQALATIMAVMEEFGTMVDVNVAYIGSPHPVLNSYLLLCPMLGANIKFKCCCKKCPVSPLLLKSSEDLVKNTNMVCKQCSCTHEVLTNAGVIIAGPTARLKEKVPEFKISIPDIEKCTFCNWIFIHTCPRGDEVDDELFDHCRARTYRAFDNLQYIAAALMVHAIKGNCF